MPRTLVCHPRTRLQAVVGIDVVVGGGVSDSLSLDFALEGELSGLRIPEPRQPRRVSDLWQHTCFEVFVMAEQGAGYREFNFSPSSEWAAYTFRGYRDGGELEIEMAPVIRVQRSRDRLELHAQVHLDCLPPGCSLRLGLSAVVEDTDGQRSYWALRHPPGRPDFHHADAFALQLNSPECVT